VPSKSEEGKWYMSCLTMSPKGELIHDYNKIHPCVLNLPGLDVTETDVCTSGASDNKNIKLIDITSRSGETFKFAFAICYDVRYPKYWLELRDRQADVVVLPTCWFFPTRAHWEPLVTTRAIDNQFYVVCPTQIGKHNESRPPSYGFSMILDPAGEKQVALGKVTDESGKMDLSVHDSFRDNIDEFPELGEGVALGYAELELKRVKEVREQLPVRDYEKEAYGNDC
jgi:predicted amidohydrolase